MLQPNEVISRDSSGKGNQEEELETYPRRKRTSIGRKSKGEGLDREWPSDNSLIASSTFHRSQGHWAFETVNGNCWNTTAEYLTQTKVDFVAVQETTTLEDSIADTEQVARNKGWRTAMSPSILTQVEGNFVGTAICCRTHIGARKSFSDECCDKVVSSRFSNETLWSGMRRWDTLWFLLLSLQLGTQ